MAHSENHDHILQKHHEENLKEHLLLRRKLRLITWTLYGIIIVGMVLYIYYVNSSLGISSR